MYRSEAPSKAFINTHRTFAALRAISVDFSDYSTAIKFVSEYLRIIYG